MHKKGKLDCAIYTVLRLRRGLTRGQKAEKGKEFVAPTINREEIQHIPARRTIQGARARLDRESAPRNCKRETSKHESLPHFYYIRGLAGQQIAESLQSGPADTLASAELLNNSLTEYFIFTKPITRVPSRAKRGKNINFITKLHKITSKRL